MPPTRRRTVSRHPAAAALLALAGVVAVCSTLAVPPASAQDAEPPNVLVVVDASSSMDRTDPDGARLMDVAAAVVRSLVVSLPDDARVGLRAYGHRVDDTPPLRGEGCLDTELLVEPGPRSDVGVDVRRESAALEPRGWRALGSAMAAVSDDLEDRGPTTVVVVAGGQDDCDTPDPCQATTTLAQGREVVVDTIGLALETDLATEQLSCMAMAGGGEFVASTDPEALSEAAEASVRRLVARQLTAVPPPAPTTPPPAPTVSDGAPRAGSTRGDALALESGTTHRQRVASTQVLWFDLGAIEAGRELSVELDRDPLEVDGSSGDYVLVSGEVRGDGDTPFAWLRTGSLDADSGATATLPAVAVPPAADQVFLRLDVTMIPAPTAQELRVRTTLSPPPEGTSGATMAADVAGGDDDAPGRRGAWALVVAGLVVLAVTAGVVARRR